MGTNGFGKASVRSTGRKFKEMTAPRCGNTRKARMAQRQTSTGEKIFSKTDCKTSAESQGQQLEGKSEKGLAQSSRVCEGLQEGAVH